MKFEYTDLDTITIKKLIADLSTLKDALDLFVSKNLMTEELKEDVFDRYSEVACDRINHMIPTKINDETVLIH